MSRLVAWVATATATAAAGCGGPAAPLRRVDMSHCTPALRAAYDARPTALAAALRQTTEWLDGPASASWYAQHAPPFTRDRVQATVRTLRELVETAADADVFVAAVTRGFDAYEAVGADGHGDVLFTGYFAPEYRASRERSAPFLHPIHVRPPDAPVGTPWRTRTAIETRNLLAGHELAWLADPLDAYLVHVNGSARLRFPDGTAMVVTHDGTNERPYTSLGRLLVDEGAIAPDAVSMQAIRAVHRRDPALVERLMRRNDRFVFFRECAPEAWPVSALGVPLTAECSLATDKDVFPPACPVLVDTTLPSPDGGVRPFARIMLDHDRGGAIVGTGRADLFLGVGDRAGEVAGRTKTRGRMYYLLLSD